MKFTSEELANMSEEKLIRKISQHSEMASLALVDGDKTDYNNHKYKVTQLREELRSRP